MELLDVLEGSHCGRSDGPAALTAALLGLYGAPAKGDEPRKAQLGTRLGLRAWRCHRPEAKWCCTPTGFGPVPPP